MVLAAILRAKSRSQTTTTTTTTTPTTPTPTIITSTQKRVVQLVFFALVFVVYVTNLYFFTPAHHNNNNNDNNRHILGIHTPSTRETYECVAPRWLEDFERKYGGHVFELVLLINVFVAVAVMIDEYFVPCLEHIIESVPLPTDVIGATFLAFGNSVPEIFTSAVATIESGKINDGLSAVLGSVVFNLLIVTAVCIYLGPVPYKLSTMVVVRDMVVFFVVITATVLIFSNQKAGLPESIILFLAYPLYCAILIYFNYGKSDTNTNNTKTNNTTNNNNTNNTNSNSTQQQNSPPPAHNTININNASFINNDNKQQDDATTEHDSLLSTDRSHHHHSLPHHQSAQQQNLEGGTLWRILVAVVFVIAWPWNKLFRVLFFKQIRESTVGTMLLSLVLMMLQFTLVYMLVKRLECGLEINGEMIGLTIVGIGLALPNALNGGLLARQGYMDLAVVATLNSCVCSIGIAIAGPWIGLNIAHNAPVRLKTNGIQAAIVLLGIVYVLFVVLLLITSWVVTTTHAHIFVVVYAVFLSLVLSGVLEPLFDPAVMDP